MIGETHAVGQGTAARCNHLGRLVARQHQLRPPQFAGRQTDRVGRSHAGQIHLRNGAPPYGASATACTHIFCAVVGVQDAAVCQCRSGSRQGIGQGRASNGRDTPRFVTRQRHISVAQFGGVHQHTVGRRTARHLERTRSQQHFRFCAKGRHICSSVAPYRHPARRKRLHARSAGGQHHVGCCSTPQRVNKTCYLIAQNLHLRLAHVHGGQANAIRLGRCRQVHPHPRVGQGRSLATAGHHRACGLVALNLDPAAPVHLGACTVLMPTQARKHGFLSVHARWGQRHGNQQAQR